MTSSPTKRQDKEVFRKIFDDHWDRFKEVYPSYATDQYEGPVEKMLGCGKASGGYSEYLCTSCGRDLRRVCFSCKSSFCLSCARGYVEEFVRQVGKMLHPGVVYRHLILTIPEQLRPMFYRARHDRGFLSVFMKCGYACLEDVVHTVRRVWVKLGAIVVIQTHGRSGQYNPHLHLIITDGGIHLEGGKWVSLGYFPYEVLHKKWQYHLFGMLTSYLDTPESRALVDGLWKKYPAGLVAHVTPGKVPASCRGLAGYLAKYVASPPIALRRLVRYEGSQVTYWYNDHQTQAKKVDTVDALTFVGRMVQHILPKGFQRVRY